MTGISFFLLFFGYHPPTFGLLHKHQTKWQAFRSIDWLGLGIFLASVVLFLLGISWGGQQYRMRFCPLCALLLSLLTKSSFSMEVSPRHIYNLPRTRVDGSFLHLG